MSSVPWRPHKQSVSLPPCRPPSYPHLVSTIPAPTHHQTIHSTGFTQTLAPSPDQHPTLELRLLSRSLYKNDHIPLNQTRKYISNKKQIPDQYCTLLPQSRSLNHFFATDSPHLHLHLNLFALAHEPEQSSSSKPNSDSPSTSPNPEHHSNQSVATDKAPEQSAHQEPPSKTHLTSIMGGTRESRADSGVSCNGNNGPHVQAGSRPKPQVHNNAGPMPKEDRSTSVMNSNRTR